MEAEGTAAVAEDFTVAGAVDFMAASAAATVVGSAVDGADTEDIVAVTAVGAGAADGVGADGVLAGDGEVIGPITDITATPIIPPTLTVTAILMAIATRTIHPIRARLMGLTAATYPDQGPTMRRA
jgi:hypothetical protein